MFYSVHHYYTQACTSVLPRIVGALAHMQPNGAVEGKDNWTYSESLCTLRFRP